jgi:hypothetical protein
MMGPLGSWAVQHSGSPLPQRAEALGCSGDTGRRTYLMLLWLSRALRPGDRSMNYDDYFVEALVRLWDERRYRVYAELERIAGQFSARSGIRPIAP